MSFLLQRFSHMSLQWGNTLYVVSLSPYFPTGFERVFNSISIKYFSSFLSYRTFWRFNTIHWSQDGFDQRGSVTTAKELISSGNIWERSHDGTVDAPLSPTIVWTISAMDGCLRAVSMTSVRHVYIYTPQINEDCWFILQYTIFHLHFSFHNNYFQFNN
jgi:hypothetical protein